MRHSTARTARTRLAVLLTGVAVTAAGLTIGAALPPTGVGDPTPSPTVACEEDMPCWVCSPNDDACAAWDVWEKADGARQLKVDPARPFRVEFVGATDGAPENLGTYDLALPGLGEKWYVFRAAYTDQP